MNAEPYASPLDKPSAPVIQRFFELRAHARDFIGGSGAVQAIHVIIAQRRVSDQRANIHRRLRRVHRIDIRGEGQIFERISVASRFIGSGGAPLSVTGDALMPQLPTITVVTPCVIFGIIFGKQMTCVSTSIKPGASTLPCASNRRRQSTRTSHPSPRWRRYARAVDQSRADDQCVSARCDSMISQRLSLAAAAMRIERMLTATQELAVVIGLLHREFGDV